MAGVSTHQIWLTLYVDEDQAQGDEAELFRDSVHEAFEDPKRWGLDGTKVTISEVHPLGKAHWIWDPDLGTHVPCCAVWIDRDGGPEKGYCLNGPLTGEAVLTGDCGEHAITTPT